MPAGDEDPAAEVPFLRPATVSIERLSLPDFKRLLVESLKIQDIDPASIADDEQLIGGRLGLDSIDALEIVIALEQRLGERIRADELDEEAFRTVAGLYHGIARHIANKHKV